MTTKWSESHALVGSGPERPTIRNWIITVSLLTLVGCAGKGGEPVAMSLQTDDRHVETASSTQHSLTDGDRWAWAAQQQLIDGEVHIEDVRSFGAPVIYSTTGGPFPDAERIGQVQIGANVTALPDWKRPNRWNPPISGVSVSTGRTYDGARAARVSEYLIPHIDDIWEPLGYANEPTSDMPGLAPFLNQPVLRLAAGTSVEHTVYALHAAALINSTLPQNKRILIGPEALPLTSVDLIPYGQIFIDFAAKWDWIPSSEAPAVLVPSYVYEWEPVSQRWEIRHMRAGHAWIDPDAFHTQAEFVRVLVRVMLHALGLRGHSLVDQFPESILRNERSTFLPTDNHVPEIDADGLLAIYTRLAPGTKPEFLTANSLAPWENESLRMHGELDSPEGAAFGVAFRNGLARPWAFGPEPSSAISESQGLSGSATWVGALLGFTPEGSSVAGRAEISADLELLTGRADFTELQEWSSPEWQDAGNWSMWGDGDLGYTIAVGGNIIRETGGDEGILTGSFVGRQHEGAVGTLERRDLSAAFGGSRTTDEFDSCTVTQEAQEDCDTRLPDPIDPNPSTDWSGSEWVSFPTQLTGQTMRPMSWFGSRYHEIFKQSGDHVDIGEIGDVKNCFLQDSYFHDCYDNAEFVPFHQLATPSGSVVLLGARGKYGPDAGRQDEDVGAIMGFTDWGYWAVGWSEEAGSVYDALAKGENRTLLHVFDPEDQFAVLYGNLGYEASERLEYLPNYSDTWRASYEGLLTAIAHNHGDRPVWGQVGVDAEFDSSSWLESVKISMRNIEGSNFAIDDIQFPTIDGSCCNERKENGTVGISSFELDRSDYYVEGEFIGPAHDAVHGVFSNGDVTGGFGALQTGAQNRPALEAQ